MSSHNIPILLSAKYEFLVASWSRKLKSKSCEFSHATHSDPEMILISAAIIFQ